MIERGVALPTFRIRTLPPRQYTVPSANIHHAEGPTCCIVFGENREFTTDGLLKNSRKCGGCLSGRSIFKNQFLPLKYQCGKNISLASRLLDECWADNSPVPPPSSQRLQNGRHKTSMRNGLCNDMQAQASPVMPRQAQAGKSRPGKPRQTQESPDLHRHAEADRGKPRQA